MALKARPLLVIKIMNQADHAPQPLIRPGFLCTGAHARLYRERMLAQAFRLGEFSEKVPGCGAVGHIRMSRPS